VSIVWSVRTQSVLGGPNFENYLPVFLEIDTKMTNEDRTQMSVPICNTCDYTFTGQFGCEKDYIFYSVYGELSLGKWKCVQITSVLTHIIVDLLMSISVAQL